MSTSVTGNGLTVLIASDYQYERDWMAFASWYSVHKMLPEADVFIALPATADTVLVARMFRWLDRAGVRRLRCDPADLLTACAAAESADIPKPYISMHDDVLAVRDLQVEQLVETTTSPDGGVVFYEKNPAEAGLSVINGLCSGCKTDEFTSFVRVGQECGRYRRDYRQGPPFTREARSDTVTVNEHLVLNLWQQMGRAYTLMRKV